MAFKIGNEKYCNINHMMTVLLILHGSFVGNYGYLLDFGVENFFYHFFH